MSGSDDVNSQTAILMTSDIMTALTAAFEQKLYTNSVNPMLCMRFFLTGVVSRVVENLLIKNATTRDLLGKSYRQQKNQIILFLLNVGLSAMVDRKASNIGMGLKAVNADLLAAWVTSALDIEKSLIAMPDGSGK